MNKLNNFLPMAILQLFIFLFLWALVPISFIPSFSQTFGGLHELIFKEGLIQETIISLKLYGIGLFLSTIFSLIISPQSNI